MKLTPVNPHFNACDQKWELMPEQDGGRRCGECERVLVDFTPYSEQEVLNRQRESGFSLCGRYTKTQVDRLHRHLAMEESQSRTPWLVSLAMGAGSLLPLGAAAQNNATVKGMISGGAEEVVVLDKIEITATKEPPRVITIMAGRMTGPRTDTTEVSLDTAKVPIAYTVPLPGVPGELRYPMLQTQQETKTVEIKGSVVDKENGEVLPFVNVMVENSNYGTTTDFDGNFTLKVPITSGVVTIKTSYLGYNDEFIRINLDTLPKVEIKLESSALLLGGFIGIVSYPATPGQKLKYWSNPANWYRRIKNRIRY